MGAKKPPVSRVRYSAWQTKVCSAPAATVGQGRQRVNPPHAAASTLSSRANARDLLPTCNTGRSGKSQRNRRFSPEQPRCHTPIPNPPPHRRSNAAQPPLKKGADVRAASGGGICSSLNDAGPSDSPHGNRLRYYLRIEQGCPMKHRLMCDNCVTLTGLSLIRQGMPEYADGDE